MMRLKKALFTAENAEIAEKNLIITQRPLRSLRLKMCFFRGVMNKIGIIKAASLQQCAIIEMSVSEER